MSTTVFTSLSPLTPIFPLSDVDDSDTNSIHSTDPTAAVHLMLGGISALADEVIRARVLHHPAEPMMKASQLHLLEHFADHRPHLFRQRVRVNPDIFDDILDQISDHPIFFNQSHNRQLPIAIQLTIFLNHAGHYGNAISPEYVAQWAGKIACAYTQEQSCPEWHNGILAADGSAFHLHAKPTLHGETFYDHKSNYSLNCQLVILPHNLLIADYQNNFNQSVSGLSMHLLP
ncbi:hypothetical protein BS17DRAFT_836590 [Gyrodon lividus]|nr:hypothetical protein BS17DRAFT_836590 [Gyrodon lividus]